MTRSRARPILRVFTNPLEASHAIRRRQLLVRAPGIHPGKDALGTIIPFRYPEARNSRWGYYHAPAGLPARET